MAPGIEPETEHKKIKACLEPSFVAVEDSKMIDMEIRPTEMFEVQEYKFGRAQIDDCIWHYDNVFLYSDGRYVHHYKVEGDGTVFGDRIETRIQVEDKNGFQLASWTVSHGLDPGNVRTESHQGKSDLMAAHWGEVKRVIRAGSCN